MGYSPRFFVSWPHCSVGGGLEEKEMEACPGMGCRNILFSLSGR